MTTITNDDFDLDIRLAVLDAEFDTTPRVSAYTSSPTKWETGCCTDNCC